MIAVASNELSFKANDLDGREPYNLEAEEAILGSILLDPRTIQIVCDRLKPEHFYISAHKSIYSSILKLYKQGKNTDLLQLTSFLSDKGILGDIGGRNKLANLLDTTVSAINIDAMATIVIEKAVRRTIRSLGLKIRQLGSDEEYELPEILSLIADKTNQIVDTPSFKTKEESQRARHDRLIEQLTEIFTGVPEPSYRHFKLKELSNQLNCSTGFLEHLYLKSLTGQCSKLLTYDELKELGGSEVREWLMNGLIPKATTICLAADGGIGKTKLVYYLAKLLIQGNKFGHFIPTGEKRKILYYQGDESAGDMSQALEMMGYSDEDINTNVRVRFGWNCENMPVLLNDLKEFQPDFVMIDSLSTANRYSVYKESDMEYARPLLEMAGYATKYQTTFLVIHHTNRAGDVRGTTAIRNAVSEVWSLSQDKSNSGTSSNDRILEINKSRSRSSGKKYRLFFNPEDISFTFLKEEVQDNSQNNLSTRERILDFLSANRDTQFTSEEISHYLNASKSTIRRLAAEMAADGLISVIRRIGRANLYYLGKFRGDHPPITPLNDPTSLARTAIKPNVVSITRSPPRSPLENRQDDLYTDDSEKGDRGDRVNGENLLFLPQPVSSCEKDALNSCTEELKPISSNNPRGDRGGDRETVYTEKNNPQEALQENNVEEDRGVIGGGDRVGDRVASPSQKSDPILNSDLQSVTKGGDSLQSVTRGEQVKSVTPPEENRSSEINELELKPVRIKYTSPWGEIRAIANPPSMDEKWDLELITPDATHVFVFLAKDEVEAQKEVKKYYRQWFNQQPKLFNKGDVVRVVAGNESLYLYNTEMVVTKYSVDGVWAQDKSGKHKGQFKFSQLKGWE